MSPFDVYCICQASYSDHLTYARLYTVTAFDLGKNQYRICGNQGKLKWFRATLFSALPPRQIMNVKIYDPLNLHLVDVHIEFDDGTQWWMVFSTPESIRDLLTSSELSYFACRGVVVLPSLCEGSIERTVRHLLVQGELEEHLMGRLNGFEPRV